LWDGADSLRVAQLVYEVVRSLVACLNQAYVLVAAFINRYRKPPIFCRLPATVFWVSSTIFRSAPISSWGFLFDILPVVLRILWLSWLLWLSRLLFRLFLFDTRFLSSLRLFLGIFRTE